MPKVTHKNTFLDSHGNKVEVGNGSVLIVSPGGHPPQFAPGLRIKKRSGHAGTFWALVALIINNNEMGVLDCFSIGFDDWKGYSYSYQNNEPTLINPERETSITIDESFVNEVFANLMSVMTANLEYGHFLLHTDFVGATRGLLDGAKFIRSELDLRRWPLEAVISWSRNYKRTPREMNQPDRDKQSIVEDTQRYYTRLFNKQYKPKLTLRGNNQRRSRNYSHVDDELKTELMTLLNNEGFIFDNFSGGIHGFIESLATCMSLESVDGSLALRSDFEDIYHIESHVNFYQGPGGNMSCNLIIYVENVNTGDNIDHAINISELFMAGHRQLVVEMFVQTVRDMIDDLMEEALLPEDEADDF